MPQLEPSSYISQFFWLTTTFLSLWFVMSWFIIPKIAEIVEARRQKIDMYLQKAENINKKAFAALERYEKALAQAKQQADKTISETRKQVESEIEQKRTLFNQDLNEKVAENEYVIAKNHQEMTEAIDDLSIRSALAILEKLHLADDTTQDKLYRLTKTRDL